MVKKNNAPVWTPETTAIEAKKYQTRSEFIKFASGAYDAARRRYGILDDVCNHMTSGKKPSRIWTREKVEKIISSCKTLKDFRINHPKAYNATMRYGWTDALEKLRRTVRPSNYWTFEVVEEEASNYNTRTAFNRNSKVAYMAAWNNGWLDDVCAHMVSTNKPTGYWTKKRVLEEAKRFSSRSEFQEKLAGACSAARREGYFEEACAHMAVKGSRYERAIYAFEFEDHSVYVGLTYDYDIRYREHQTQGKHIGKKLQKVSAKFVRFDKWYSLGNR